METDTKLKVAMDALKRIASGKAVCISREYDPTPTEKEIAAKALGDIRRIALVNVSRFLMDNGIFTTAFDDFDWDQPDSEKEAMDLAQKLFAIHQADDTISLVKKQLKDFAKTIKHCGDYGELFFNEEHGSVIWVAGDADFEPDNVEQGILTGYDEVKKGFLSIEGVKEVDIWDECSPDDHESLGKFGIDKSLEMI